MCLLCLCVMLCCLFSIECIRKPLLTVELDNSGSLFWQLTKTQGCHMALSETRCQKKHDHWALFLFTQVFFFNCSWPNLHGLSYFVESGNPDITHLPCTPYALPRESPMFICPIHQWCIEIPVHVSPKLLDGCKR